MENPHNPKASLRISQFDRVSLQVCQELWENNSTLN